MKKILKGVVVLLIAAMIFSSVAATADTAEEQISSACAKINENIVNNPKTKDTILISNNNNRGDLFIQEPLDPADPDINAYTSATNLGAIVYDNFWDIDEPICDIHWWGFTDLCCWDPGDPVGMTFDIIFYLDDGGQPGVVQFFYEDITYSWTWTGIYYNWGDIFELIYFEADLDPCCPLQNGWVSIQSTYSPNDYSFLWMNSKDGDLLCYQNSNTWPFDVSFILTGSDQEPPTAPIITGPHSGFPFMSYTFTFTSTDPNGDDVSYMIEWGDGKTTGWTSYQSSGTAYGDNHRWMGLGTFTIRAKARDTSGLESPWAEYKISIPKNKEVNRPLINILQCHPNMFPLLQKLIQQFGFDL